MATRKKKEAPKKSTTRFTAKKEETVEQTKGIITISGIRVVGEIHVLKSLYSQFDGTQEVIEASATVQVFIPYAGTEETIEAMLKDPNFLEKLDNHAIGVMYGYVNRTCVKCKISVIGRFFSQEEIFRQNEATDVGAYLVGNADFVYWQ